MCGGGEPRLGADVADVADRSDSLSPAAAPPMMGYYANYSMPQPAMPQSAGAETNVYVGDIEHGATEFQLMSTLLPRYASPPVSCVQ